MAVFRCEKINNYIKNVIEVLDSKPKKWIGYINVQGFKDNTTLILIEYCIRYLNDKRVINFTYPYYGDDQISEARDIVAKLDMCCERNNEDFFKYSGRFGFNFYDKLSDITEGGCSYSMGIF